LDEAVNHYLRAIELGERSLRIIRRVTDLLYNGTLFRGDQLWDQLPVNLLGSNLQQQITAEAIRNRDYEPRSTWPEGQKRPTLMIFGSGSGSCKFCHWPPGSLG
jgi:hypothetical protein